MALRRSRMKAQLDEMWFHMVAVMQCSLLVLMKLVVMTMIILVWLFGQYVSSQCFFLFILRRKCLG